MEYRPSTRTLNNWIVSPWWKNSDQTFHKNSVVSLWNHCEGFDVHCTLSNCFIAATLESFPSWIALSMFCLSISTSFDSECWRGLSKMLSFWKPFAGGLVCTGSLSLSSSDFPNIRVKNWLADIPCSCYRENSLFYQLWPFIQVLILFDCRHDVPISDALQPLLMVFWYNASDMGKLNQRSSWADDSGQRLNLVQKGQRYKRCKRDRLWLPLLTLVELTWGK